MRDLADRGHDAGEDDHHERADRDRGVPPQRRANGYAADARGERHRAQPAEPQAGGEHVDDDGQQVGHRRLGEHVAGERIAGEDSARGDQADPRTHPAPAAYDEQRDRGHADEREPREIRPAGGRVGQQPEVERARGAGRGRGERSGDGGEPGDQPGRRREAQDPRLRGGRDLVRTAQAVQQ